MRTSTTPRSVAGLRVFFRGVGSEIWEVMLSWISPMAVEPPVNTTRAVAYRSGRVDWWLDCHRRYPREHHFPDLRADTPEEEGSVAVDHGGTREKHVELVLLDGLRILNSAGLLCNTTSQISEPTPLKKKLNDFGDMLAKVITIICVLVWVINYGT
jgi:hypothetical protein